MPGYSTKDDFLVANIPLPSSLNGEKFVDDARDEIDSIIGSRYVTPINMSETGPVARHSRLLIKRISVSLSTGRMILAIATGFEENSLHAYGARLVRDALNALEKIRSGEVILDGAALLDAYTGDDSVSILQHDDTSIVDTFESFAMGGAGGELCPPVWRPGGLG